MYELREGQFDDFFEAPFRCYPAGSPYVSPLRSDLRRLLSRAHNPLFAEGRGDFTFYTVRRAGQVLGRIVAHVHDESNRRHRLGRSYFGFFDCADDEPAARLLLEAAETWGRGQGCAEIAGNFNLTAMQQIGVMTAGYDHAPYTDQAYGPPHIPRLLTACGYEPIFPMTTFEVDLARVDPATLLGTLQRALLDSTHLEWRRLSRWTIRQAMRDACAVLNDGFAENPMFVPLTEEEFLFQARDMMWIVDPAISVIVYRKGPRSAWSSAFPTSIPSCVPHARGSGGRRLCTTCGIAGIASGR